jgi:hypothetical protein
MRFDKVLVTIDVQLKPEALRQYLPRSVGVIGLTLSAIAIDYVHQYKTGYFPAIDFFKTVDTVDPDLIVSAEQVAWLVSKLARETIQSTLLPIFSSVRFRSIQTHAFSLPKIRPGKSDTKKLLAEFYTPDSVKVELVLTMMRRDSDAEDGRAEPYARKMMFRWLEAEFESIEITSSKIL